MKQETQMKMNKKNSNISIKEKIFKLKTTKNFLSLLESNQLELGSFKFESNTMFKCYYMVLGNTRKDIILAYSPLFINSTKKDISPIFNNDVRFKILTLAQNKNKKDISPLSMWDVICITKISKKEYKSIVIRNKINIYKDYGSALFIKNNIISIFKQNFMNYIHEKEDILWLFNTSSSYFTNSKKLSPK